MIALLAGLALAVTPLTPALPAAGTCQVIRAAAVVHTPDGPQAGWTVVMEGGRITALGPQPVAPERCGPSACDCVDGAGLHVTAGLIEAHSQLGLIEIDLESGTADTDGGGDPVRAALRAADAYDPGSIVIPVQAVAGVTGTITHPSGGRIAGQSAYVQLRGDTQAEAVVLPTAGMDAAFRVDPSRAMDLLALEELLADARAYRANAAAFERNQVRPLAASQRDLQAMLLVLDGRIPLVVAANRAPDIEALLRLQQAFGFRLIVEGGAEAWRVAPALAAAKVPVVLDPLVYGPSSMDQLGGRSDNPALLARAGVPVVISTFATHNARNLRQYAGNAVRGGMDRRAALDAITRGPADAYGLADRGRLQVGAVADVVLWTGDPLELSTTAARVWIGGEPIPPETRQTRLRDKYRKLPGSPVSVIPLP